MNLIDNVGKSIGFITQEAKKTYDAKKLELRIKNYRKEEIELYTKLGRLVYQHRGVPGSSQLDVIINNLETIHARMKHLDKQIIDIRSGSDDNNAQGFQRLDRKDSDLTIIRTNDGIKLIRPCAVCKTANSPDAEACVYCGRLFSETEDDDI
jgi:hypothetical protein